MKRFILVLSLLSIIVAYPISQVSGLFKRKLLFNKNKEGKNEISNKDHRITIKGLFYLERTGQNNQ
ncbi:hypothetical protein [Bacillus subtilis]|uniref:hypothetical protein n=1 Tax=Bacillus subtilis TaxID=1423 RepID=UPI0021C7A596|nr:hypothetical protein [Bacillus subtilis]UXM89287.1 hypothetical protein N8A75_09820 [Bacillus subtilis]